MSKKWLAREGDRWVREELVTPDQLARIRALYDDGSPERSVGVLPLLGGLLLGLGVLSFVAANWQALANELRQAQLLAVMLAAYAAGGRLIARGRERLGVAIASVGLFAFGGGMILVHQMFHMVMYGAATLVVWSAAGAALAYTLRSRYLYAVALVLTFVAQGYSLSAFGGRFSWTAFAVLALALPWFALRRRESRFVPALWSIGIVGQTLLLVLAMEWPFGAMFVPMALLYAVGDLLRGDRLRRAVQWPALAAAFLFALGIVLFAGPLGAPTPLDAWVYLPALLALFAVSAYAKRRRGDALSLLDWLPFAPFLYAAPSAMPVLYLVAAFAFALYALLRGYEEESRPRINSGTAAFLLATMAAYFKLTWAFLDKSLFFLLGGALLLTLSWFLGRRKKVVLREATKEEER
ncbi:DUF2157 domain-containing protein [Paenibacillus sp.]|uniref:DUF2157 domain-containing protein n=1 Tax=Paenibacillus sp. TaxID=58172 RepID=UPI002812444C|nr:DUF2157 domain-containing protein [Paenibacillus sp.]